MVVTLSGMEQVVLLDVILLAPIEVVLGLYNTDGVEFPELGHMTQGDYCVILRFKLKYVSRTITIITTIATCYNNISVHSGYDK